MDTDSFDYSKFIHLSQYIPKRFDVFERKYQVSKKTIMKTAQRSTSVSDEDKDIRESKRLKILVTKERCNDTYGEIRDGCVDDVTSTLNSNLVLHKDTKLLSQKDFSPVDKHVLPVVPFTVAHSTDRNYIRNTAKIIARMMEKLQRCMSFVLTEIRIDADYWGESINYEMEIIILR